MGDDVPGAVVKVIEVVGSSSSSFSDAVRNAVKVASKTVRHIKSVDVINSTAEVGDDGDIRTYKVHCKLAFLLEQSLDGNGAMAAGEAASVSGGARAAGAVPRG